MTALIVIASIATILTFIIQLFGIKIDPDDLKKFIKIRGRTLAWNTYLVIATLITIYFLLVLSLLFSTLSFSISLATLVVLILWGILSIWTPAIQRLNNKRINAIVEIITICLVTLTVLGFWIVKWPEIQQPLFASLLLLVIIVVYIVSIVIKKRKSNHN